MRSVLVEISTKDRDSVLGRCLAALLQQSFCEWDLLIINDGYVDVGSTPTTQLILDAIRENHLVWITEGSHISQAHNHNIPLYEEPWIVYPYILRLDDDVLLSKDALHYAYYGLAYHPIWGAVGGLWFDAEEKAEYLSDDLHDRKILWTLDDLKNNPSWNTSVGDFNSNWAQRMYPPAGHEVFTAQHIYSSCLYRAEAMRQVGGWPEVYSKGVAHGEETDGTYRLYLSGYQLAIDSRITGNHLRAGGGIRTERNLSQVQQMDTLRWRERWRHFGDINWSPRVAIECRHQYGLGGAERLFYSTIHELQELAGKTLGEVVPVFTGPHFTPEECETAFGFSYQDIKPAGPIDVLIVIGHSPEHATEATRKIFYCLFPIASVTQAQLGAFDEIVAISDYSAKYIAEMWGFKARTIYPSVAENGAVKTTEKENIILTTCRAVPYKSPLWLAQMFVEELDLPDWELHMVLATSVEEFSSYEQAVLDYAAKHDNIVIHRNVGWKELEVLYARARIFWSAVGMLLQDEPQAAEHYGYAPVEAEAADCIPIVFDRGGHQETVPEEYRWSTKEELLDITRGVAADRVTSYLPDPRFAPDTFRWLMSNTALRVNGMAIQKVRTERIEVIDKPIRVAMICDAPHYPELGYGVPTGFGVVAGQVLRGFLGAGFQVSAIGLMDQWTVAKRDSGLPFDLFPPIGDPEGRKMIPAYIQWAQPDVVFCLHAPGDQLGWVRSVKMLVPTMPIVSYFPVEGGKRINGAIPELVELSAIPVTYCENGKALMYECGVRSSNVRVAHHGIDHAEFAPIDPDERAHLRKIVGWEGKFVVGNVATNKRVKRQPALIDAMRILLREGYDDIYMYLHTRAYNQFILQGWHLIQILEQDEAHYGVPLRTHVLFPETIDVPYRQEAQAWRFTMAPDPSMRGAQFNGLDYITRLGMLDMYIDPSSAEGCGLPTLEAAACGIPFVSVDDGMYRNEIHAKYGHMMQPNYWDEWQTGTMLAMVTPEEIADAIIDMYEHPERREEFADARSRLLREQAWAPQVEKFVGFVREANAIPR